MENQQKLIHTFGALAEIGSEVIQKQNFQEMIRTSLHLLLGSLAIMRGGVARYSKFGHEFNMLSVRGLGDEFPLSLAMCPEDERQFIANGVYPIEVSQAKVLPFFQVYDRSLEEKSIELAIPLVVHDEIVGLVLLGQKANGLPYSSYDKQIICVMARHIAVGIAQRNLMAELERKAEENQKLYDTLRMTYADTVKAFATAIDCKDKYTDGHSIRVGKYSEIIAAELGWGEDQVEGAAVAGYLHDVGKLTVERNILNAPYRINAKESAESQESPRRNGPDVPEAVYSEQEPEHSGTEAKGIATEPEQEQVQEHRQEQKQEEKQEQEQAETTESVVPAVAAEPVRNESAEDSDAQQWRNLLASVLHKTYREACIAIVDFLHERYSVESVAWLEKREAHFETLMADGRFIGRQFRISMGAGDERLKGALAGETSLELRSTTSEGQTITVSLFPVAVGGDIKSALAISGGAESPEAKKRIARFCSAFAAEIEILRLRDEVQRRSLVSNAVERFNRSLDKIESEQFWSDLLNISAELMQAERGSLMIFDEDRKEFDIVAVVGASPSRLKSDKGSVGKRVAEAVLRRGLPIVVADAGKAGLPPAADGRSYRGGSFISYPFRIGEGKLGVLNVTDKVDGTEYTAQDLEMLNAVAPQFNVLIDRATLISKAGEYQQLSVTDPLTGLLNRRYLRERLAEEVQRTVRSGQQMSFMMIDVDEFKSYNDTFGHSEGDIALQTVARCLKESLRGADVAVRFGGEEFSILLPQTSAEVARIIGERVRAKVAATRFRNRAVTVSIGIASCCNKIKTADGLIEAADKALYVAKREGRNRVKQFNEQESTVNNTVLDPVGKTRK